MLQSLISLSFSWAKIRILPVSFRIVPRPMSVNCHLELTRHKSALRGWSDQRSKISWVARATRAALANPSMVRVIASNRRGRLPPKCIRLSRCSMKRIATPQRVNANPYHHRAGKKQTGYQYAGYDRERHDEQRERAWNQSAITPTTSPLCLW